MSEMSMRERVARALCKERGEDPDKMVMPGITMPAGYTKPAGPSRALWTFKLPEADAAIAAMAPSYSSLLAAAQGAVDAWFNEPNPTESDGWPKQMLVLRDAISAAQAETTS